MTVQTNQNRFTTIISFIKKSLSHENHDYTKGSMRTAIFLLAIPMMLEMCMESVFAVVDIFFVSKLGAHAATTVGLTESMLTIIYSMAIGISMASTAMVARRIGEKDEAGASHAAAQSFILTGSISLLISIVGIIWAPHLLRLMGADATVLKEGSTYCRIMLGGNIIIMLLFLINGIFRGAGNAAIAMKSLWIANICNIIFCPVFIYGIGSFEGFGLTGAAIATTLGRSIGVAYQLFYLLKGKGVLHLKYKQFFPDKTILKSLSNIASTGTLQFLIASASWIFLARIIAGFGSDAMAGYTIAIRLLIFFLMPAWGISNAAATLVGQNLGAQQPERAAQSVWKTAKYNGLFMAIVSLLFISSAEFFVGLFSVSGTTLSVGVKALRIVSIGYIFYGVGMVMMNAFNGAGDSRTPTWMNLFWFWCFQVPLAWLSTTYFDWGIDGVFIAIVSAEVGLTITSVILFRQGKWKKIKI